MFNNIDLCKTIKEIRKKQGLSQQDIASYLNVSRSSIATLENKGRINITVEEVIKISNLLGINLFDLLKLNEKQETSIISKAKITAQIHDFIEEIEKESERYREEIQRLREVHIKQTTKNVKKLLNIVESLKGE